MSAGDDIEVTLSYPRSGGPAGVVVDMCDVRAADPIRVIYDFDRDGWVIQQTPARDVEPDEILAWQEVAFVKAWGLK